MVTLCCSGTPPTTPTPEDLSSLVLQTTSTSSISQITSSWMEPLRPLQTCLLNSSQSTPYTLLDGESLQPLDSYPGSAPSCTRTSREHLQSEGLAADYSIDNSPIRKSFMQIGALPFVPVSDVDQAWRLLKPSLPAEMTAFARYFESTWIGTTSTPPLFSHDSWNHHEASQMLLPRSSNVAEGWNSGFASLVNCHNPSIWKFLECIKREQALTDVKITNILTRRPFKRAAKWEKFDLEIQRIVDDYDNFGDVTEFLKAVGSKILG